MELPQHLLASNSVNSLVIIIVVVVVIVVAAGALVLICCCCRQQRNTKLKKKTADMEVSHRGVVTQQVRFSLKSLLLCVLHRKTALFSLRIKLCIVEIRL